MMPVLIFLKIDLIVFSAKLSNARIVKSLPFIRASPVNSLLKINF